MCLSEPTNSISVRRPSLSTSGTNTMEVNLPLWHPWRNFSPSLGFLRLMRAMEGEGKKQCQRTSFHQSFHHFLETGTSTWSPSSWWPTVSLWSCWSTQVKSYTLTILRYISFFLPSVSIGNSGQIIQREKGKDHIPKLEKIFRSNGSVQCSQKYV